jgi:LPXTG-site transpeptidase (sortase) family protein
MDYYQISELEQSETRASLWRGLGAQLSWMAIFSMLIFTVGFFTMNAQAYSDIMMTWVGQDFAEAQETALQDSVSTKVVPERTMVVRSTPEEQKTTIPDLNLEVVPPDDRLIIPSLGKNVPIVTTDPSKLIGADWKTLEQAFQEDLKSGVIHYPGTADPGEDGNVFITGHSSYYLWDSGRYKDVFARLNQLQIGDEITIYHDQDKFQYVVREKREVKNEDVSVLDQGDEKILTLMTCSPVGTNFRRLVVVAEQV